MASRRWPNVKGREGIRSRDEKLRAEVIRLHHDTPVGGHGGTVEDGRVGDKEFLVVTNH